MAEEIIAVKVRRNFALAVVCCALTANAARTEIARAREDALEVASPNGRVRVGLSQTGESLTYHVTFDGQPVIEPSPLGIVVDGLNLGSGATIDGLTRERIDERYASRGVHDEAINRASAARLTVRHQPSRTTYRIDVRVFDDGVGIRTVVPGSGTRLPDAAMGFTFPPATTVWLHGLRDHYEAVYERRTVESIADGTWAAPPVTVKLPGSAGYASITEAALIRYAGMALQADGARRFRERLAHAAPVGYPFTLRYGETEGQRLAKAAAIDGEIVTPWRVILIGKDLNALVNSDIVANLSPPPDQTLFPQGVNTPWIKPGRAVWRYLDGGENTVAGIKEFSQLASELGFEYQVVEGQWQRWSEAELRDVVDYSRARGVGIIVWRHRNTLAEAQKRRELFASWQKAGVVGVKVDFLDHEAREVIDLYQAILKDAAEFHLMIDFHGANKPAGESRTWPNEMTREGIYGLEHRGMAAWASFNTTFPFARMLAGHADYTPVVFGPRRRETSWAHQIASAVILTSPLLVYGGHPASFLLNPAVEMIKSIPSTWNETIVLPPSEIGELAMFARRSGTRWFVAAMNGPTARTVKIDLAFAGKGVYQALVVRDDPYMSGMVEVERRTIDISAPLEIAMREAGGFVIRLSK